ncbi:MAG: prephenate dehydratase [Actinobacteria bacterium]|nr:prephenate dehydratase [Actinomycetota bacterium]
MRIAYLGPEGTFSEEAMLRYAPEAEGVPCVDVPSALDMVRMGEVDHAVVPIENSVEGGVNATLDTLAHGSALMIVGEVLVPITFTLVARPGTALEDVRTVGTHPHGWAQCRRWMHENLPEAVHVPTSSTAAGAAELASGEAEYDAGLCSRISAERYGVEILADGIADNWHAITRFVVVSTPRRLPRPTGADKTTLMVHLAHNEAGGLLDMLEQFAVRGVNLSRIESRPIGDSLGRYGFSIDAEGHVTEERMQAVLIGLHRVCPLVRFMGSYPSAEGRPIRLRPGTSDADFIAARTWVRSLLDS